MRINIKPRHASIAILIALIVTPIVIMSKLAMTVFLAAITASLATAATVYLAVVLTFGLCENKWPTFRWPRKLTREEETVRIMREAEELVRSIDRRVKNIPK